MAKTQNTTQAQLVEDAKAAEEAAKKVAAKAEEQAQKEKERAERREAKAKAREAARAEKASRPKEKRVRPVYPMPVQEDGTPGKLDFCPGDFNFKTMKRLGRKNFSAESFWYEYQAAEATWKARVFTAKAEEARLTGDADSRRKVRKIARLTEDLKALREQLAAAGLNPDDLLAKMLAAKGDVIAQSTEGSAQPQG